MEKRNVFIILCFLVTILFIGCSIDNENSVFSEFFSSITSIFESSSENSELSEQESSFSSIIEHKHEYKEEID